jgi:hypothetical protein
MTISTVTNRAQWQGNGATTVFSFSFEIDSVSEIVLLLTNPTGSVSTVSPSSYSASGLGNPAGGTITYPLSGSPLATGYSLTLARVVPLQQLADIVNQSNYFPLQVENALDYLMMAIQQIATTASYALQAPIVDSSPGVALPAAAARAGYILGFDANGNVEMLPLPASVGAGNLIIENGSAGTPGFAANVDFTPNTTTQLTLSQAYGSKANVSVHFDSAYQAPDQYSISGNVITFTSAIPGGISKVYIIGGTTLSVSVPSNGTVNAAQLAYAISGTTANRPAAAPDGWRYLDTSLSTYGTPITKSHLSSTGWVNYAGTQV